MEATETDKILEEMDKEDDRRMDTINESSSLNSELRLTAGLLEETFNDPKFIAQIQQMVHHAHLNLSESVFIAREDNEKPIISRIVRSPRMKSDPMQSYGVAYSAQMFDDQGISYNNVFFGVHSHPIDPTENSWEQSIVPSNQDFMTFEKLSLQRKGIIHGIVARDKGDAKLLLLQFPPDSSHQTYYQTYEYPQSFATLKRLLTESGIRNIVVTLPKKSTSFPPSEIVKIRDFATSPQIKAA
jgi:hypothetical protein